MKAGFQLEEAGCNSYKTCLSCNRFETEGYDGDEGIFFWNKRFQGGKLGPGVFEVDTSLDEFDDYILFSARLSAVSETDLMIENVDEHLFLYNREAQELFNTIMIAELANNYGIMMTIYCGLLEHLSKTLAAQKAPEILTELDTLVEQVKSALLSKDDKKSLVDYLNSYRNLSAIQRCIKLCEKYADKQYGGHVVKDIVKKAYSVRSSFSHGDDCEIFDLGISRFMKFIVLDVIMNYMREKESKIGS